MVQGNGVVTEVSKTDLLGPFLATEEEILPALPESIRIGWQTFDVVETTSLTGDGLAGEIRYMENVIRMMPGLGKDFALGVLVHEIVHGVLYAAGIREHDEQLVDVTAQGFIQVVRDNPDLVRLMQGIV